MEEHLMLHTKSSEKNVRASNYKVEKYIIIKDIVLIIIWLVFKPKTMNEYLYNKKYKKLFEIIINFNTKKLL